MKVIDLSTPLYDDMDVYEGDPRVKIRVVHTHESHSWELREMCMGTHTGTHVDAFSHMHKDGKTLDDIPLDRFFGEAQLITNLEDAKRDIGLIFLNKVGTELLNEILSLNPRFVGGDLSEELERRLLEREVVTYTGLINLDLLPKDKTFMFYGLPLRISSGDGSPVRAMAII